MYIWRKKFIVIKIELNKKNENEKIFSIFDYNNNQFIYTFKFNNISSSTIFLNILNFDNINIQGFIMMDKNLNIYQYLYDENYENKVYNIYNIDSNEDKSNQLKGLINLIKKYNYI